MSYSWIERLSIVKISVLPKVMNVTSIRIPARGFVDIDKIILKFI